MPRCKHCNQLNKVADCFQDPEFPSNQYCSKEHWILYKKEKNKKQIVDTSQFKEAKVPKATPKKKEPEEPKPKHDRIKLTDYIKDNWSVEPNWKRISKQIETLCEEWELTYDEMRVILRYCIEIKGVEVDETYGLGQFIPKYIDESNKFKEDIQRIKDSLISIDFEDEFQSVPIGKVKSCRVLKEDVGF